MRGRIKYQACLRILSRHHLRDLTVVAIPDSLSNHQIRKSRQWLSHPTSACRPSGKLRRVVSHPTRWRYRHNRRQKTLTRMTITRPSRRLLVHRKQNASRVRSRFQNRLLAILIKPSRPKAPKQQVPMQRIQIIHSYRN